MIEDSLVPISPAYKELMRLAKNGETTEYRKLAENIDIDLDDKNERGYLSSLLEAISRFEVSHGRPMLTALVLAHGKEKPNDGFFILARDLGLYNGENRSEFHATMLERIYEQWKIW